MSKLSERVEYLLDYTRQQNKERKAPFDDPDFLAWQPSSVLSVSQNDLEAILAALRAHETGASGTVVCGACGELWTGQKCGQAENGHAFPVCYPYAERQVAETTETVVSGEAHASMLKAAKVTQHAVLTAARKTIEGMREALQIALNSSEYTRDDGGTNCRFCDEDMDHEGTFKDMHNKDCIVHRFRAALAQANKTEGDT